LMLLWISVELTRITLQKFFGVKK